MSYNQTLWKELKEVVNPKILSKQNRYKKWRYGWHTFWIFYWFIYRSFIRDQSVLWINTSCLHDDRIFLFLSKRRKSTSEQDIFYLIMGSYIISSILNIFSNCLSTTSNPESIHVHYKVDINIYLHISFYWHFTSDYTFVQNLVEYVKVR